MLKIQHPGSIARDRDKKVSDWESVRHYKYANGVECQILIGHLPHGHIQSAITANRAFTIRIEGKDAVLAFSDAPGHMVDFLSGHRPTGESANTQILDACHFLPSVKVAVRLGADASDLASEGKHLVATFGDGTKVSIEPHGSHGHVEASRDGQALKTFYNGQDNTLYVLDPIEPRT